MYSQPASPKHGVAPLKPVGLLERARDVARYKHYSIRTEKAYVEWIRRFIHFHGKRHPREMGASDIRSFLSWLAGRREVAAATHQQALSALLFLYRDVLELEVSWLGDLERPKKPKRLPAVLSVDEASRLLSLMEGARFDGALTLRYGHAFDGMRALADQGCRL